MMKYSDRQITRIKNFLKQTSGLSSEFYYLLCQMDKKVPQQHFYDCFFKELPYDNVEKQYNSFNLTQQRKENLWSSLNNGLKYTMIFDYIGSTQEFENFGLKNQNHRKNNPVDIELFVLYPRNDQIYNSIAHLFTWKQQCLARITDDSSMTLCLNHSLLHTRWQKHFHFYLLEWRQKQRFSPGDAIGIESSMESSLNQIQKYLDPKIDNLSWFYQQRLFEYRKGENQKILISGSSNEPLVRSAGLIEYYLQAIKQYININKGVPQTGKHNRLNKLERQEFLKNVIYLYMLDQHDQSSLTHYGLQGQISILLLAYIQINLIIKQQFQQNPEPLSQTLGKLIREFRDKHFAQIMKSYFQDQIDVDKILIKLNEIIQDKSNESYQFQWEKYLNVNSRFDEKKIERIEILEQQIIILYYTLFYENEDSQFNWEDPNFIQYLSQKRHLQEGFNLHIAYPSHNSQSRYLSCFSSSKLFYTTEKYNKILQKSDSVYFGSYSPDCLCIVFYLLSKGKQLNKDIYDFLFDICVHKGDSDSYGAVLGTLLFCYDFKYHQNYINPIFQNRDDFMNHFMRIQLDNNIFNDLIFSKNYLTTQLPKADRKLNQEYKYL